MSDITLGSLRFITREDLSERLLAGEASPSSSSSIAVVDVRDSDYIGGHIKGCINAPTPDLDWRMPELVRTLKDKETVVFHCALSQVRGPKAALEYLRLKRKLDGADNHNQRVLVLHGGFSKWQEKFGTDERLTEAYKKDLWENQFD